MNQDQPPNKSAAAKRGITGLLAIEHRCPGLPEPGRSAASSVKIYEHTYSI